jgi:ATP-dependent Clp protease ATP-binding subunit ClpX
MKPTEINDFIKQDVIGQEESLRYVSVAIFKHLEGEPFGNLMLIGSSGTGKTTIMRSIERLYESHQELHQYRVVVIINANTFASDEGTVDTTRLFTRLEERARRILGPQADPEEIGRYMEHATVCLDEIDKVSGVVGGKPYVTGLNIQQALLTLIEGEKVDWALASDDPGRTQRQVVHFNTGNMLFFCAGAFEALYEQVFRRVTSPTSRVKLPTETVLVDDGRVEIREYFTLRHHFRQEDLFDYGMQPQFLSRFDNAIILEDLHADLLQRIFTDTRDSLFGASRNFFRRYNIDLSITEGAAKRIAEEASRSPRIGARALKAVYAKIIKPFEYDPFGAPQVQRHGEQWQLLIDETLVRQALKPELQLF